MKGLGVGISIKYSAGWKRCYRICRIIPYCLSTHIIVATGAAPQNQITRAKRWSSLIKMRKGSKWQMMMRGTGR